jgi:hypothetical protein
LLISLAAARFIVSRETMNRAAAQLMRCIMTTTDTQAVVGVFTDRRHAEVAMDALRHVPFPEHDIGFLSPTGSGTAEDTPTARLEHKAEDGAVTGAVAGGAVGAVAGGVAVAVGLIPGIGPVIAGGVLLGVLGGAAAGAALGTYLGPFIGMRNVNDSLAHHIERELVGGHTIVTVRAGGRAEKAMDILRDHGAVSVHGPGVPASEDAVRPS